MRQFKNVVPLMVSLKNEAMRERHWKELMKKTGEWTIFGRLERFRNVCIGN